MASEVFSGCRQWLHQTANQPTVKSYLREKSAMTTYEQVGGLKTFRRLARVFYARVTRDPLLQPTVRSCLGVVLGIRVRPDHIGQVVDPRGREGVDALRSKVTAA